MVPPRAKHCSIGCVERGEKQQKTKTKTRWNADTLRVCFEYLDANSLAQCEAVNSEWRHEVRVPIVWEKLYCLWWRRGRSLPAALQLEKLSVVDWKNTIAVFAPAPLSVCTQHPLQPLMISRQTVMTRQPLQSAVCYFEARIKGCGSVGLTSPLNANARFRYGAAPNAHAHVGSLAVSYGYHSSNGRVSWIESLSGAGRRSVAYGPPWGIDMRTRWWGNETTPTDAEPDTIGCGVMRPSGQLFFTKNGAFLGFVSVRVLTTRDYAAAVTLSSREDVVDLNVGRKAFVFDIEGFIAGDGAITP